MHSQSKVLYGNKFKNPKKIYVSDKIGGKAIAMSPEEFASKNGFTWCEANVVDAGNPTEFQDLTSPLDLPEHAIDFITEEIANNRNKLVMTYMGEDGYGVFARKDIPPNTYITTGVGYLKKLVTKTFFQYGIGITNPNSGEFVSLLDAQNVRNFSSFLQALPKSNKDFELITGEKKTFATENVLKLQFSYQGYPIIFFKTPPNTTVHAKSILGWDYGTTYWMGCSTVPHLYTLKGEILPLTSYRVTKLSIFINYQGKHAHFEYSLSELNKIFADNNGFFSYQLSDNEVHSIPEWIIMDEYNKNPQKPYIVIDESNIIMEPVTHKK